MRNRADKPPGPPRRTPRGGKGGAEPRSVIRRREHQVLTLTEQGWRQEAIADHLGITQAAVSKILRRVTSAPCGSWLTRSRTARCEARATWNTSAARDDGAGSRANRGGSGGARPRAPGLTAPRSSHKTSSSTNIQIPDARSGPQGRRGPRGPARADRVEVVRRAIGSTAADGPAATPPTQ